MKWSLLFALVAFVACSGGGGSSNGPPPPPPPNLRPSNAPDVLVFSVSGRCHTPCISPDQNQPYLGYSGSAREAVEDVFQDLGYTTDYADAISSLYSFDDTNNGESDRHGFLELVDGLEWAYDNWIRDFSNPTRIVIVAHSHGCVWAHMAATVVPFVPIDYLISLDGNCFLWESDYVPDINHYFARHGNPFSWDIRDPCDRWRIPGLRALQDTEDVVAPNVAVNLEVRSADILQVRDWQVNHRTDGSRNRVFTFDASFDSHSSVHLQKGESLPWVLLQLRALELARR